MRSRNNNTGTPSRPRPKTIHVDAGSNDAYNSRTLSSSKGKRGSGTNLAGSLLCVQPKQKKKKKTNLLITSGISSYLENRSDSRGEGVRGSNPALSRRGSNSSLHGGKRNKKKK